MINEWFNEIYHIELDDVVPDKIKELFEVARGTMTYGYFYYPIFTLASEQFTRIAEAAANIKCVTLNCPKSKNTFRKKVDWLLQESILSNESHSKWESILLLRNKFSHPSKQNIFTPFMAINLMTSIAKSINQLFTKTG